MRLQHPEPGRGRRAGVLPRWLGGWVAGFASYNEVQSVMRVSVSVLSNLDTIDATRIGRNLASMARE